jgi:hypothetical protein
MKEQRALNCSGNIGTGEAMGSAPLQALTR